MAVVIGGLHRSSAFHKTLLCNIFNFAADPFPQLNDHDYVFWPFNSNLPFDNNLFLFSLL